MDKFVVNAREGGRCHLVVGSAMELPRPFRKTICGWRFGSAVSLSASKSVKWGLLCRKCFPAVVAHDASHSPIEDVD